VGRRQLRQRFDRLDAVGAHAERGQHRHGDALVDDVVFDDEGGLHERRIRVLVSVHAPFRRKRSAIRTSCPPDSDDN
jgi:hypothetical protein